MLNNELLGVGICQVLTTTSTITDSVTNIVTLVCTCATALATCVVVIYNMWKHKKTKQELYGDDLIKDEIKKEEKEIVENNEKECL